MDFCVIDIETIPCQSLPSECRPAFDESEVKLGNLKDRFKIEEKIEQARAAFEANISKTMSLDPDLCQVLCVVVYEAQSKEYRSWYAKTEMDEYLMLREIWKWIETQVKREIPLVGFNSMGFDIPVLIRRAMILDIPVPARLVRNLLKRQEQNRAHLDLMLLLGSRNPFSGKLEVKGLNYYLRRLSLSSGKFNNMTGADVYPRYLAGEHEEILEYCKADVSLTVSLWERVAPWFAMPKPEYSIAVAAI